MHVNSQLRGYSPLFYPLLTHNSVNISIPSNIRCQNIVSNTYHFHYSLGTLKHIVFIFEKRSHICTLAYVSEKLRYRFLTSDQLVSSLARAKQLCIVIG